MFCELAILYVSFAAFFEFETLFPSVRPHVALQMIRSSGNVHAFIALVRLFSCMLPHYMSFQVSHCNAVILAHCASVRLFSRVGPFVPPQIV